MVVHHPWLFSIHPSISILSNYVFQWIRLTPAPEADIMRTLNAITCPRAAEWAKSAFMGDQGTKDLKVLNVSCHLNVGSPS